MKTNDIISQLQVLGVKWVNSFPRSWRWHGVIIGGNSRESYSRIRALRAGASFPPIPYLRKSLVAKEKTLRANGVVFRSLL